MSSQHGQTIEAIKAYIDKLDLSLVANNMVQKQKWLPSEVREACRFYKNFLFLKYKYPNETLAPSEDIDEFWHNHILDTQRYRQDCEKIFGCYLDHYPYFGIDGQTTLADLDAAFATTQRLHMEVFGVPIVSVRYTKICYYLRRLFVEN